MTTKTRRTDKSTKLHPQASPRPAKLIHFPSNVAFSISLSSTSSALVSIGTKSPSQISSALKNIGSVTGHSQAQYIIPWINLLVIQQTQSQFYRPKFKRLRYDLKHWSKGISNLKLLIENKVILYPDTLEELRPLFNTEWNLRRIVKNQLMKLLQQQRK